ncbi:hypothetical protein DXG01_010386 [Tephrocybe rancida]|nr:hypothetical protein DXG01_010386 [Tephrocybe rancida]
MPSKPSSSSSTLVSPDNSHIIPKEHSPRLPSFYPRPDDEWTRSEILWNFRDAEIEPLPTLYILQMLADAYEERRTVWTFNKHRERQEGDDPAMYGPINQAQQNVREYLTNCRLLVREASQESEASSEATASSAGRCRRKKECRKPGMSTRMLHAFQRFLRIDGQPQKLKTLTRYGRQKKLLPTTPAPIARPARPALPRIVPPFYFIHLQQRTLRRMTRADSRRLRSSSIRERKFTPAPIYEPSAEDLGALHPPSALTLPCWEPRIQHDSWQYRTLSWLPPEQRYACGRPPVQRPEASIAKEETLPVKPLYTPFYIHLMTFFLIQFVFFGLLCCGFCVALWGVLLAILKALNSCWSIVVCAIAGHSGDSLKESSEFP